MGEGEGGLAVRAVREGAPKRPAAVPQSPWGSGPVRWSLGQAKDGALSKDYLKHSEIHR